MDEIVEKLKDLCDPSTVEQRAARVTELHTGTPLNHILYSLSVEHAMWDVNTNVVVAD